jgi:hypothetical protein
MLPIGRTLFPRMDVEVERLNYTSGSQRESQGYENSRLEKPGSSVR